MSIQSDISGEQNLLAGFEVTIQNIPESLSEQVTPHSITLGESLLNPGLQTTVEFQSYLHTLPPKNWDLLKGKPISIKIEKPILQKFGINPNMLVVQKIYRLSNRRRLNNNIETFRVDACDPSLLEDAESLVSKYWKCTRPSSVVSEVLSQCAGVRNLSVEPCEPARDYVAENIHPFQVVEQQANVALANGNDPSFIHYMTYENLGTHHFKSLYNLTKQSPIITYYYDEVATTSGIGNVKGIMSYEFPCDFDLLLDVLNGVGQTGKSINSIVVYNFFKKMFNLLGTQTIDCGIGSGDPKIAFSNEGSAEEHNSCPDYSKYYRNKRQARMLLIDQDKIALRLQVPFNTQLHVGKVINVDLRNKNDEKVPLYGFGTYLIHSLKHHIKRGGHAVTTLDCVSTTVGSGEV